ncbi:MAG: hypothetical protein QOF79_2098 [Actinomycetota bacterium]|jgi:heat shock protein HslJ|nr:hypothetical protein [Actinomycetota bacterium]
MRITARLVACALALVIGLMAGGCADPADQGGPDPQLRGQWELTNATDSGGTFDLSNQHITLTIEGDTSTTGRSACSDYRAQLFGTVNSLWVRTELPKRIDCGSQIQQTLEQRYIAALQGVRSASVRGGVLELTAPSIHLRFAKALARPVELLVGHTWTLSSMSAVSFFEARIGGQNPANDFMLNATVMFSQQGAIRGKTGCRAFSGHVIQNAGEMLVEDLVKTEPVACDSSDAAVDENVFRVLGTAFTFQPGADNLTLVSSRVGIALFFVETS